MKDIPWVVPTRQNKFILRFFKEAVGDIRQYIHKNIEFLVSEYRYDEYVV